MKKVIFEKDGRIGRITLNRPDKLNAIDDQVPGQLQDAVLEAEDDSDICLLYTSPSPRDATLSRMPSSA